MSLLALRTDSLARRSLEGSAGKVELPPVRGAGYEPSASSGEPTGVARYRDAEGWRKEEGMQGTRDGRRNTVERGAGGEIWKEEKKAKDD